ncbi:MAG: thiol reductant ABC exporter subunit CydC [Firmicutes bacterium]|nr:thiol reductant ABC exporter subunit CydC [Bacillota bacterium]
MKTFFRLLRLLAPHWKMMLWAVLLGFCTIGSNVGLMATSAYLIAWAALHPPILNLMGATAAVRFFGIARAVFRYLERYFSHHVTFRLLSQLRVWFYQALEPLAPARLMDYRSGDLLSRIVADVETLKNFYLRVLSPPLVALMILGPVFALLAHFQTKFAYVVLFFFLLAGVVVPLGIRLLGRRVGRQRVETRARLHAHLVDSIQGMTEIVAFHQAEQRLTRMNSLNRELLQLQGRMSTLAGLTGSLTGFAMNLAMWTVLVLAIPMVESGEMKGIYLAMLALAVLSSFEAVAPLPLIFPHLEESLAAAKRLFDITDAEPAVQSPAVSAGRPEKYDLQVTGVSFRYDAESPWTLKNLDFCLPQGGRVAVVGPSGAGKSTLVNLLLRFWDYDRGSICLGSRIIKEYSQEDILSLIGVVTQRTHLFNATVRENLLLAEPGAGQEEVIQAARRARIHSFIESLPQGYETYIGEGGFKLSGGQRQRLAIARALLKDAPVLILDEATAGLDPVTEKEVMEDIYELMKGRTTLVITHRLTGLEVMDEIVVLDRGQVVERGTQEELLRQHGLFRKMWDLAHQIIS